MSKKKQVKSYYDQYSKQYDTFYLPIQHEKFKNIRSHLDPSSCLMDLGGGTGIMSQWIKSEVINIDIAYGMLEQGLQYRSFHAIAGDLEHLPIRNKAINNFISLTAYQNVPNLRIALSELIRILIPVSQGLLTFLEKTSKRDDLEEIFESVGLNYSLIPFSGEDICYLIHL